MSASSLADARAQCLALGVDTRVGGHNLTACMDLLAPFCPNGVDSQGPGGIPQCAQAAPDPRKAAILLAEAQARAKTGPPWLAIGVTVGVVGFLSYLALR